LRTSGTEHILLSGQRIVKSNQEVNKGREVFEVVRRDPRP
jgi:hypothetical protein